jgi:hypothetical protein
MSAERKLLPLRSGDIFGLMATPSRLSGANLQADRLHMECAVRIRRMDCREAIRNLFKKLISLAFGDMPMVGLPGGTEPSGKGCPVGMDHISRNQLNRAGRQASLFQLGTILIRAKESVGKLLGSDSGILKDPNYFVTVPFPTHL